ncbi:uncharacterized protein [Diadema setosum]|uniref:uncharacterized protein n=1 Tax=Diadema setosum TaxID=31175 RepID=UPI003B3A6564
MEDHGADPGPGGQESYTMPTTPDRQPPTPGLLKLRELNIKNGQITILDEKRIQSTLSVMFNILTRRVNSPPILNAARNVAGLMFYHSYKKDKAIKFWQETVEYDPQNLNALQDLATAYRKLPNDREAIEYECKIKELQENASDKGKQLMMARCQLEQALTQFWVIHTECGTDVYLEGRKKQVESYEAGLHLARKCYEEAQHQREKRDWLLCTAHAYERLSNAFFRMGDHTNHLKAIGTTTEILDMVVQKCEQDDVFQADVWYVMGNTFATKVHHLLQSEVTLPKIVAEKYNREWNDPSSCYRRALQFDPSNVWILGRLGICLFKAGNNKEAITFLNKSIEAAHKQGQDDHMKRSCWNALVQRAELRINETRRIQKGKDKRSLEETYQLIQQAMQDASMSMEYNFSPVNLAVLAEAQFLLSRHPHTSRKDAKELRDTALQNFYESSVCQQGNTRANTYLNWADCLMDKWDLTAAIETYKIAFETDTRHSKTYKASQLLRAMFQNFKSGKKSGYLFKELTFWFTHIYRHCQPKGFEFDKLLWSYASEVLDVMECLVCQTPLPSNEMGLYEEMIQPALEDFSNMLNNRKFKYSLQKQNCTDFESRLKNLIQENKWNINNCPKVPKSKVVASPRDHQEPPKHPLTEGVEYDFCVIYDIGNYTVEGWVEFSLLSGLECPSYGLKGCFDKRDIRLGQLGLKEAWTPALTQSAYILIVLTHKMNRVSTVLSEMSQEIEGKEIIVIQLEATDVPIPLHIYHKFDFTVKPDIPVLARYLMSQSRSSFT